MMVFDQLEKQLRQERENMVPTHIGYATNYYAKDGNQGRSDFQVAFTVP